MREKKQDSCSSTSLVSYGYGTQYLFLGGGTPCRLDGPGRLLCFFWDNNSKRFRRGEVGNISSVVYVLFLSLALLT